MIPSQAFYCMFSCFGFFDSFMVRWETISPRKPCAYSSFTPISFKREKAESWSEPWRACESTSIPVWHFGSKRWDEKTQMWWYSSDHMYSNMSCKYSTPGNSAEQVACSAVSTSRCGVEGLSKAWLRRVPNQGFFITKRCFSELLTC